jgi:UPF0271 protein
MSAALSFESVTRECYSGEIESEEATSLQKIDLNADCGESFGAWTLGRDDELLALVSSANVACGMHAGDPRVMEETVGLCRRLGVAIGAHPGYPDLQGFGRRALSLSPEEVRAFVLYQVGALAAFCRANEMPLVHLKAHGALYNAAARDPALARAIAGAAWAFNPRTILLAQSGSAMVEAGREIGLRVAEEAFADRAYDSQGQLLPRNQPDAVLHDPEVIARRVLQIVLEGEVTAASGERVHLAADSVCLHGDNPSALEAARAVRQALEKAGVAVCSLTELV